MTSPDSPLSTAHTEDPHTPNLIPELYSPEELALVQFGEPKEGLIFGAALKAERYLNVKRTLQPLLRHKDHPYHRAAHSLWKEIEAAARENVRTALKQQGVEAAGDDSSATLESLLGMAALREWPDVATAILLQELESGDRWALLQAGNIDQNTDFLALHLRSLLHHPELRPSFGVHAAPRAASLRH